MNTRHWLLAWVLAVWLTGCSREAVAIRFGQDECAHCKMTMIDQRFGAELVTAKGKVFVFDDLTCLFQYQQEKSAALGAGAQIYVVDFAHPGQLVPAASAHYLRDDGLRSPMGSGVAAFAHPAGRDQARQSLRSARTFTWAELPRTP